MKRRLLKTVLTAACALSPLAAVPAGTALAQTVTAPRGEIVLSIGKGELITLPGAITDVFIADPAIADVQIKSQRQLYLFGKGGGETTLYASNASGAIVWSSTVRVGSNISSIDQMLHLAMPEAHVNVATMGTNTILLTGTVAAPDDAAEAQRLVTAFVGDKVNVISRLKTATPLQVNLRVRFAEVSRSLVRQLGSNLTSMDRSSGFQFGISNGRQASKNLVAGFDPKLPLGMGQAVSGYTTDPITGKLVQMAGTNVTPAQGIGTIAGMGKFLGLDLLGTLDAGETAGLVTTLSEPNLTALSGETAEFLAGGEFPIPVSSGLGSTSIEYKNYGVSLAYTPTVLANGRISIRVRPEVSELSTQGAVTVNNFVIPALTTRRAETTVELGSGQSFMIAGLLSNNAQNAVTKLPGVGDLPIIGALFKSTDFRKGQTELVIVVTPYLVNPIADESQVHLPTDGYQSADQMQQWLLNREQAGVSGATRPMPTAAQPAPPPAVGLNETTKPAQVADKPRALAAAAPGFSLK